jgi:hypothetical protein
MMTLTNENESLANAKVAELTFKKLVILPRKQPSLSEGLALFALPASLNLSSSGTGRYEDSTNPFPRSYFSHPHSMVPSTDSNEVCGNVLVN